MFHSNQSKFYQELDGKLHKEDIILYNEETRKFQPRIWDKDVKHKESADWIQ